MVLTQLISELEKLYPVSIASDWDNSGLQIGRLQTEVRKIYIAFECTLDSIDEAIKFGADLMITHHPLLFNPIKNITDSECVGARIERALSNKMAVYSLHTNYDIISMGNLTLKMLGCKTPEVLDEEEHYGGIYELPSTVKARDFAIKVKDTFKLPDIRVFGDLNKDVKRIAILPGAGKSYSNVALSKGCDVLLTGDVDHHSGLDSAENGLIVMDCGHYGLEYVFVDDIYNTIKTMYESGIEIKCQKIIFPYEVI